MKELLEIFECIKDALSFLWEKPLTENDKKLRQYNWVLCALIGFLLLYGGYFFVRQQKALFPSKPEIVEIKYIPTPNQKTNLPSLSRHFNKSVVSSLSSNASIPVVVSTNVTTNQFFYGETVEIKSFGVYGIIHEKILGVYGYTYVVRYKDNSHALHDVECYTDELLRPEPRSLPPSALLN